MKRLIVFLMLFIAVEANAQIIFYWSDGDYVGGLKTNFNQSMSNVVAAIAGGGVVTTNAHGGGIKIVGSTDSNTFYFLPYFTGSVGVAASLVELSNGVINVGLEATNAGLGVTQVGLAATNAGLGVTQVGIAATNAASMASWKGTNLLSLAFGAGNTAIVLRSDALLGRPFKVDVTSTPASITFEGSWPTNEIADAFLSIQKGTNSLTLVGATIIDSGRAGSTNVFPSSTNRTGVLFHKELGESKFYSIQMDP